MTSPVDVARRADWDAVLRLAIVDVARAERPPWPVPSK
jgi:hypothetical protein